MSGYEVPDPIQNSPFDPPSKHWHIVEGEEPELRPGRRQAVYYYRDPKARDAQGQAAGGTLLIARSAWAPLAEQARIEMAGVKPVDIRSGLVLARGQGRMPWTLSAE